jgi:DNA-binding Lrp family transcriptional regulator
MENGSALKSIAAELERGIPIAGAPFAEMSSRLGLPEEAICRAAREMAASGLIRRFGAFFDFGRLGFKGYLFGAEIRSEDDEMIRRVCEKNNVTHAYGRKHSLDFWFTVLSRGEDEARVISENFRRENRAFVALSMKTRIKLRPSFGGGSPEEERTAEPPSDFISAAGETEDIKIIRALQDGLEISVRPFDGAAKLAGVETGELIERARLLKIRGVLRRVGASLDHNRAGWRANSLMAFGVPGAWDTEPGGAISRVVAPLPWASHCYARAVFDSCLAGQWPYNLYIMIHAGTEDELTRREDFLRGEFPGAACLAMRTEREYKKSAMKI